jgi:DNA processing protein
LVSEFPPGTPPRKYHFPQRNRLIAGLARGVLVVEAPGKSGAMITAEYALEEGKEVFAVPGPIHNPTSHGTNRLIQEGAALVTSAADILRILQLRTGEPLPEPLAGGLDVDAFERRLQIEPEPGASELTRRIWATLADGARDVDEIASAVAATPAALATALLELELAGMIERLPGPRYARCLPLR